MTDGELFDELDFDADGMLSRHELHQVAALLGWHWPQAPIFALLDFLTIRIPLDKEAFVSCMAQIGRDPDGVYGQVLRQGPLTAELSGLVRPRVISAVNPWTGKGGLPHPDQGTVRDVAAAAGVSGRLEDIQDHHVSGEYATAVAELGIPQLTVCADEAALLIIDPQRSFTSGEWMRSLGPDGDREAMPIRRAFDSCARLLQAVYPRAEVMFTRCPFPPESYGWDDRLEGIIDPGQLYFIKPGNNAFVPATNGYREWMEALIKRGIKVLVMGGCTLNSCVRVSALETRLRFRGHELSIVVDLSLCGARASNYAGSALFGGVSSVETAIREMSSAGIMVAEQVVWL